MAKKFWTFIGNNKYDIGLTGSTVYVYDKQGTELATFKDLTYAYNAVISPLGDIFVVKTTDGRMAVYSFEPLKLIKNFDFQRLMAVRTITWYLVRIGNIYIASKVMQLTQKTC